LADAGEHGVAAVLAGDAGDEFLDDEGLSEAGPAEEARLAAADEGGEQVDDLDARLEDLGLGGEVGELRRLAVDGAVVGGVDGAAVVDRLAEEVEDAAERLLADGDAEGAAGVGDLGAAAEAVGGAEGDGANLPAAKVAGDLAGEGDLVAIDAHGDVDGVIDGGE